VKANTNAWVFNGNNVIYSTQSIARIQDIEGIVVTEEDKVKSVVSNFILNISWWYWVPVVWRVTVCTAIKGRKIKRPFYGFNLNLSE